MPLISSNTRDPRRLVVKQCGCDPCAPGPLDILAAELGMANSDSSFYETLVTLIENNSTSTVIDLETIDSSTVLLSGDGTAGSPLEAKLTNDAIQSTDGSVSVTVLPDGQFDLSVTSEPINVNVSNSATVLLEGDGSAATPLVASFAPNAITSVGGTVAVTQGGNGVFNLEVAGVGGSVSTQDTATISLVGDGTPGTPLQASFAPNAITAADSSVTVTQAPNGTFSISASSSSDTFIPRTTIVGATGGFGSTPKATTLLAALATIPLPLSSPWTLLILPGTYTDVNPLNLPPLVNLQAFEPNTVIVDQPVNYTDATNIDTRVVFSDIHFTRGMTISSATKTGGSFTFVWERCSLDSASSFLLVDMRSLSDATRDRCLFYRASISTSASIFGGITTVSDSQALGTWAVGDLLNTTRFQVNGEYFSPTNYTQTGANTVGTFADTKIGGNFVANDSSVLNISSCTPTSMSIAQPISVLPWTIQNNSSSMTRIFNTPIQTEVRRMSSSEYELINGVLIPGTGVPGRVDREIDLCLANWPTNAEASTVSLYLRVPLITPPVPPPLGPPPYTLPTLSKVQITAPTGGAYLSSASTPDTLSIVNQTNIGSNYANVSVVPQPTGALLWL